MNKVIHGDNLAAMQQLDEQSFQLIYVDPPFNTGKLQERKTLQVTRSEKGDRVGFAGQRYSTEELDRRSYTDSFDDYLGFLAPRLERAWNLLREDGTLYVHLDQRESHYAKVLMDQLFGRDQFLNEIIWAYDYGGRSKRRWPAKHDTILVYVKNRDKYIFNYDEIERIPYMAPDLVGPEKAARGKLPTDVWWHTIVPTNGKEKTGYPTQKPEGILRRIIEASSTMDGWVLDFFAGSGTTGAVAQQMGRNFVLIDENPVAIDTMRTRLGESSVLFETVAGL